MPAPDDQSSFLASLPAAVRAALQAQDVQALDLALRQMPSDKAEALARWLLMAGVLVKRTEADLEVEQRTAFLPPVVAAALAQAQASDTDVLYEALATLPPDEADRLYAQLQEQGML
jgi:hypothetical protein